MSDDLMRAARQYFAYFNQGELWVPNGKPPVRISDMDPAWRHNAAAFLERNAKAYLFKFELGETLMIWGSCAREVIGEDDGQPVYGEIVSLGPTPGSWAEAAVEDELEAAWTERGANPAAWIRSTDLYQALTGGLPANAAELARHWSDCAIRTTGGGCTCRSRHVTECPKRDDINEACRCRDYSPEWTR